MGLAALRVHADPMAILVDAARPLLRRLARETRATAHLGVFENDMISYVVKEHGGGARLFTREGGQLEAYCSAIGKVLLAHLPDEEREAYLASGPFVALTSRTITDPAVIRETLSQVRSRGFAIDDREIADDLSCVAVPIEGPSGDVMAALSISTAYRDGVKAALMDSLRRCADAVSKRLG
jgi:DNA-binding IclR family transcriptional regulator